MKPTSKRKSTRLLAKDERLLAPRVVTLLAHLGFSVSGPDDTWTRHSHRFNCTFKVRFYPNDGHPWLACRFDRPYPHPDLLWNNPLNSRIFRDIEAAIGAAAISGKYNYHVFDRDSIPNILASFERHLRSALYHPCNRCCECSHRISPYKTGRSTTTETEYLCPPCYDSLLIDGQIPPSEPCHDSRSA